VIGALVIVLLVVSCGGEVSTTEASATPGRSIAERNGCLSCHSLDGSRRAGPSWKGLYGSHVELEDGRVVVADEEYLDRAIREPGREVVKGFAASMPLVSLSDQDRQQVIEYIRSLADPGEAP
jgi:cytochrome c oxidase subunit 2